jgi:membrane fusion protein (multidrug efflux system)
MRFSEYAVRPRVRPTALAALAAALALCSCTKKEAAPPPPAEVVVTEAVQKDVPVMMEMVGQTKGSQDVEIRARVEGYLDKFFFTEGAFVKKGAKLYQIDPKPFEAQVAQAKANLATVQARLDQATITVNRLTPLVAQKAVSRQELDNATANQDAARAQVDAARASLDKATLDLGYTSIASPIDGVVGTTLVKAGNLVGRGESTLLTTVSQVDPIVFRAGISEAEYLRIARRADELRAERGGEKTQIQLLLADGTIHPQTGQLEAIERAVDPTTGTLAVQFTFPNPDRLVRPGQYGRARFQVEARKGALLVPQRAVQELQNLYSLAIVGSDNKVTFHNVKVGPRVDGMWVIEEGLKPGDKVVVEGIQRIRDGMTVSPKEAAPVPAGSGTAEPTTGTR